MPACHRCGRRAAVFLALTLALGASLTACASSGSGGAPAGRAPASGNPRVAAVTVTSAAGWVPDRAAFPAGPITFTITNRDATAVSEVELLSGERIVGEKEN